MPARSSLLVLSLLASCWSGVATAQSAPVHCADLSFLDDMERAGAQYADAAGSGDAMVLFQRRGLDAVRLRLWHTPADGRDGLADVLALARRVRALDLDLFLALHFSDTWADPAQQQVPAAWAGLPFPVLTDSVSAYAERVVRALADQGTPPALVQIGNEITGGMLWPHGRVGGAFDTPEQWDRLSTLLHAAADGVRSGASPAPSVALHIDRGGDLDGATWFFDRALADDVPVDVLALSYYPWWHGEIGDLERTLDGVADRYGLPVLVAETAYPWTLGWFDDETNIVGLPDQLLDAFPATPAGQAQFIARVTEAVARTPGGLGFCYWAPDYVAAPDFPSPWENLALFDETGLLLPAADLDGLSITTEPPPESADARTLRLYPNPAADAVRISVEDCARLAVFDPVGRRVLSLPCDSDLVLDVRALSAASYLLVAYGQDGRVRARERFSVVR